MEQKVAVILVYMLKFFSKDRCFLTFEMIAKGP
jgi:hypothetical protein